MNKNILLVEQEEEQKEEEDLCGICGICESPYVEAV
jgi:hypothetical protein